ncbi:MAG: sensor histidine kinase [Porcipelethomonas sp.]
MKHQKRINTSFLCTIAATAAAIITAVAVLSASIPAIVESDREKMVSISEYIEDSIDSSVSPAKLCSRCSLKACSILDGYSFFLLDEDGGYICGTTETSPEAYKELDVMLEDDEYFSASFFEETVLIRKAYNKSDAYYIVLLSSSKDTAKTILRLAIAAETPVLLTGTSAFFVSRTVSKKRKTGDNEAETTSGEYTDTQTPPDTKQEYTSETLKKMDAKYKANEKQKNEFISDISHELKTPLTVINGFIGGILDGTIPETEQHKYLVRISNESERMSRLVKNLLKISGVEAGKLTLDFTDIKVSSLVIEVMLMFEKQISEKNVSIEGLDIENNIFIRSDRDILYQVIYNITENAVKFVNEGGRIIISNTSDNDFAYISITNTGAAIPDNDIPRIFDRFYKAETSENHNTGVGLGLSIVKKFVSTLDGNITIKSNDIRSTEVTLTLPVNHPEQ